jgi:hypothetical protein
MLEQIHQVVPPNQVKHFFDVKIAKESSHFLFVHLSCQISHIQKIIMDAPFIFYEITLGQVRQHHHLGD